MWGGHPVSCAVALANLGVFDSEDVLGNVRRNEGWLSERLRDLQARHEIVGDVRGTGYFWALELVKDRERRVGFTDEEAEARRCWSSATADRGHRTHEAVTCEVAVSLT